MNLLALSAVLSLYALFQLMPMRYVDRIYRAPWWLAYVELPIVCGGWW